MIPLLAAAAESAEAATFQGQWFSVAFLALNAVGVLSGIAFLFATKRELDAQIKRIDTLESDIKKLPERLNEMESEMTAQGERRSTVLHNRINPLVENTAGIKAGLEAHNENFRNFTTLIELLAREKKS